MVGLLTLRESSRSRQKRACRQLHSHKRQRCDGIVRPWSIGARALPRWWWSSLRNGCIGFFCSALLGASVARANDATFGGAGADLVPLDESRVQMLSEDIVIEYRGQWHVTALYVFENSTSNAIRLQVGFPEIRCQNADDDCSNVPFRNLRTEVEGKVVQHRVGSVAAPHPWKPYLGVVWLYDVTFPPHETTRVRHSYSIESGGDVEGNLFTTYVTRTGAAWANDIGRARFTFRLPAAAHTVVVPEGITLLSVRTVDPEGPAPHVEVVCEEENWAPKDDLFLAFNATARLAMSRSKSARQGALPPQDICPYETPEDDRSARQKQMCINDEYAVAGYPFKNESLQRFYYGDAADWHTEPSAWDTSQLWYVRGLRPFPGLTAWKEALATSSGATPPTAATSTAPLPSEILRSKVNSTTTSTAGFGATRTELATAAVEPSDDTRTNPPPIRERPGGCGCQLTSTTPPRMWLLLAPLVLSVRRVRKRLTRPRSQSL